MANAVLCLKSAEEGRICEYETGRYGLAPRLWPRWITSANLVYSSDDQPFMPDSRPSRVVIR